jgi:VWFA-related protein
VFEDGVRQEISAFSFVDLPTSRTVREADATAGDEGGSPAEGRRFVMILNGHGPRIARAATIFVDRALSRDDEMSVYYNSPITGAFVEGQPFTASKPLLRSVIRKVEPAFRPFQPTLFLDPREAQQWRARLELERFEMLRNAMEQISTTPGRKKAVLWFGGGFPFRFEGPRGAELALAYRDVIRAASRYHVVIYPIDHVGLTNRLGGRELMRMAGLRALAEDTGVEAIVGTNDFEKGYDRIVREMSTYYLLGYYPPDQSRDGRFHSIKVRVKRPGMTVRARKGYYALEPPIASPEPRRAPPEVDAALRTLTDVLSRPIQPLPADGVTATAGTTDGEPVFWRADSRARSAYVQTANPRFTRTERLRVEIPMAAGVDATARLLDRAGSALALRPSVTQRVDEPGTSRWIVVDLALAPLAQGEYVLEVIAGDAVRLAAFRVVP